MPPRCPTCGAPVDYAPDGDPKYDPARARFQVGDVSVVEHTDGSETSAIRLPDLPGGKMHIQLHRS